MGGLLAMKKALFLDVLHIVSNWREHKKKEEEEKKERERLEEQTRQETERYARLIEENDGDYMLAILLL